MHVPNGLGFEKWRIKRKWLVGWSVNLAKLAKIAISEPIWLEFGMDVPNVQQL